MALLDGDAFVSGDIVSFQQMNRMKDNWRAAAAVGSPQPGMLHSDSDDDLLYHRLAAAWGMILQGGVSSTLGDDIYLYIGSGPDGSLRYDETTNDAIIFGLPITAKRGLIFCNQADVAADHTGLIGAVTQPSIFLLDDDADSYLGLTFDADDGPAINVGGVATILKTNAILEYTRQGNLLQWTYQGSVADDGTFNLPAITTAAIGLITCGNAEHTIFYVDDDGDVTLISNSANVVANADTDANLCIGTAATQEPLTIRNRLGAPLVVNLIVWYD